jgi:hypothetical protein
MQDHAEKPGPDLTQISEQTKEVVARVRGMAEELRTVLEHEERVAGDLLRGTKEV